MFLTGPVQHVRTRPSVTIVFLTDMCRSLEIIILRDDVHVIPNTNPYFRVRKDVESAVP